MQIITTPVALDQALAAEREAQKTIGLVPTMGALHAGHASLVSRSVSENDVTVVSVFVNPTQFNDKCDLDSYPRNLEADCALLESLGADIVFAPTVEAAYPEPDTRQFSYPPIDTVMEGGKRPGHFNGVCQIVSKLFLWTRPDRAYFGEKDFQQIAVVRAMTADLHLPVEIRPCPIVREESGLALSSRNALLTPEQRQTAVHISAVLQESTQFALETSVGELHDAVVAAINAKEGLETEYFDIVDGNTLQSIERWDDAEYVVGCVTVYCGKIRLIDNIRYK